MVLDARRRSLLYERFAPLIGEENANALMSEFPSVEADELVTKQFLRAELAEFRADLRAEFGGEFAGLRGEFAGLRGEFGDLRGEFVGLRGEVRGGLAELRAEMADRFHQQTVWLGGAIAAATAVLAALTTIT